MTDDMMELTQRMRFDALTLEYSTLREEVSGTLASRHQAQTIFAASGSLLAGLAPKDGPVAQGWLITLGLTLIAIAAGSWFRSGRMVGTLSRHLAQLEVDINDVILQGFKAETPLMTWETTHQTVRGPWRRTFFGPGEIPQHREPSPKSSNMRT